MATPPRCHGGGGPAGPPEDVDPPSESSVSEDPVFDVSVGAPFGASSPGDVPSASSTAGTRVVDSAVELPEDGFSESAGRAGSSVSVRAPPAPDVSAPSGRAPLRVVSLDVAESGSSGLLGVLTRTRLVGR